MRIFNLSCIPVQVLVMITAKMFKSEIVSEYIEYKSICYYSFNR